MRTAAGLSFALMSGIAASSVSHSFKEFKDTCSKTYNTRGYELHAYECWKRNVKEILKLNSASTTAQFAENCMSDICPGERSSGLPPADPDANFPPCDVTSDGDESWYIDWDEAGMVTPVKTQGTCGSCSFF